MNDHWIIIGLAVLLLLLFSGGGKCQKEGYDDYAVVNPTYLQEVGDPGHDQYQEQVIQNQGNEIRRLRKQVKKMAEMIDDGSADSPTQVFFRRKLSNKYYPVAPHLSGGEEVDGALSLEDDDFSTKTLSTIKFLSQTRPSKYYGTEVHFPTELCDNFCETEDRNAAFHEQIDLVRPISPTSYIGQKSK